MTTQDPPTEETNARTLDLNINDLATLQHIVETASSRGAFKASELSVVGQTYDKLTAFLEQVAKLQSQSPVEENVQ